MANRLSVTGGRVIISKAGYNAEASLPDAFKVFDSAWGISGLIIARGVVNVPTDVVSVTIPFPQQHYVPYAEVYGFYDDNKTYMVPGYCTTNAIICGWTDYNPGNNTVPRIIDGQLRYIVYGISQ